MDEARFDDLDSFLAACAQRGVTAIGLRAVDETRPTFEGTRVTVGPTRWVRLNAYARPLILKVHLPDADGMTLKARLEALGYTVRLRSDNLT